jgi:hypothetical protein
MFISYIIYFVITIVILVLVHEFGHFAAAKLCGMRADVFAIGFGKRLFGWNKLTGFTFGDLPEDMLKLPEWWMKASILNLQIKNPNRMNFVLNHHGRK